MATAQGLSMVIAPVLGTFVYGWNASAPFGLIGGMLASVFAGTWLQAYRKTAEPICPS